MNLSAKIVCKIVRFGNVSAKFDVSFNTYAKQTYYNKTNGYKRGFVL